VNINLKSKILIFRLDDDVEREMHEVERSNENEYTVKVDKLRKVFVLGKRNIIAVD